MLGGEMTPFFRGDELLARVAHPRRYALSSALHERAAEGAVAAEATLVGQLFGTDGQAGGGSLLVEVDEVVDAQIVDIGIVGDALTREILAEIRAVGTNGLGQLLKG
jgi:hypothetical protein